MLHELRELEARVLRLDRTLQSFSLAKTVLPVLHTPGWATHAEIFSADATLDAMERKIKELTELMHRLTAAGEVQRVPHGSRQTPVRHRTPQIQPVGNS